MQQLKSIVKEVSQDQMQQPPHCLIGQVRWKRKGDDWRVATGILLSPDLVLTHARTIVKVE